MNATLWNRADFRTEEDKTIKKRSVLEVGDQTGTLLDLWRYGDHKVARGPELDVDLIE